MTSTKMSHTWLASHTGPMPWWLSSRIARPRGESPATRYQKPAPKSAKPSTAYATRPMRMKTIGTSASDTRLPRRARAVGRPGRPLERHAGEAPEHPDDADGEDQAHERERPVADGDARGARHRGPRQHDVVDDPGLAPHL